MKRVAIFVILAALTVGFSSCSAVRHCQAPEVEMPGQIASGYTDSLTIADLSWWQFYGDSTLRRVIELTLENNKDMLAAAARVEQMRQLYRISKAERLPNFSAKGLADYETNDYADEESSRDPEFSAKLSVSWELDLWGNLRWAKRKGGAEYLSSVEDWRAMRMTLVAEVATAYFQLMALVTSFPSCVVRSERAARVCSRRSCGSRAVLPPKPFTSRPKWNTLRRRP